MRKQILSTPIWAVAFGLSAFSASALNNLFVTYYLELFVTRVSPEWFYVGQAVFAVWNALNDPVFGWISDRVVESGGRERTDFIRWGGFLWVLCFLLTWWPWGDGGGGGEGGGGGGVGGGEGGGIGWLGGLHFVVSLCLYDGMLTLVEVNHGALLAEVAGSEGERAEANKWSGVLAALGSFSSLAAHLWWDPEDLRAFRTVCLVVGALASVGFELCARIVSKRIRSRGKGGRSGGGGGGESGGGSGGGGGGGGGLSVGVFLRQLAAHRNFRTFSAISVLQVFDCTFEKNFFAPFLDVLAGAELSAWLRGLIVSASFFLPHVGTVLLTPAIRARGLYAVLRSVFRFRLALLGVGGLAALWGYMNGQGIVPAAAVAAAFMLANRTVSELVCRLSPLILADLVDEDRVLHRRNRGLAASIVGSAAFASKFSQSAAPAMGFFVLGTYGGENGLANALQHQRAAEPSAITPHDTLPDPSTHPPPPPPPPTPQDALPNPSTQPTPLSPPSSLPVLMRVIWLLLLVVPAIIVTIQALCWASFTLRGKELLRVQQAAALLDAPPTHTPPAAPEDRKRRKEAKKTEDEILVLDV